MFFGLDLRYRLRAIKLLLGSGQGNSSEPESRSFPYLKRLNILMLTWTYHPLSASVSRKHNQCQMQGHGLTSVWVAPSQHLVSLFEVGTELTEVSRILLWACAIYGFLTFDVAFQLGEEINKEILFVHLFLNIMLLRWDNQITRILQKYDLKHKNKIISWMKVIKLIEAQSIHLVHGPGEAKQWGRQFLSP